jgi:hypothetical protein
MTDSALSKSVSPLSPEDLPQHPVILRRKAAELFRSANDSTTAEAATEQRGRANDYAERANRIEAAARPPRRRAEWLSPEYDDGAP